MHSIRITPAAVTAILFLTFYQLAAADRHADYCSSLMASRVLKPGEIVEDETYYFCHPTTPNAFVKCLFGMPRGTNAVPRLKAVRLSGLEFLSAFCVSRRWYVF